ncbi:lipocalin-like isoform 1-T1 [Pluvialis apricaria]
MHATLLGILGLALLGALHAQDSVPVQTDFQQDKLTGRWYSIGLASNSNWFKEKKHLMKMCTTVISATADGNLEVTSTYPKGDQCEKRNSLYTKTEQPGRFRYTSPRECPAPSPSSCRAAPTCPQLPAQPHYCLSLLLLSLEHLGAGSVPGAEPCPPRLLAGWGSKHDIRVVETNYEEYALVATQISKSTGSFTMVLLYSRTKELSPERLERFTQFSREQGLTDEEILILPQTDKCMADAA